MLVTRVKMAIDGARKYVAVAAVLVGSTVAMAQTYTSPLPTELQPSAVITTAANESKTWLVPGIGIVVGLAFLGAIVGAFKRRATRPVR